MVAYYLTDVKYKNFVLLVSSILFYSWGGPKFIFVILGTTLVDFFLVQQMDKAKNDTKRKLLLTVSVCMNLGLLFYFKYSNFFIENFNEILGLFGCKNVQWTKLVLPIGISFYTFETLTYVVDVYRRVHKPLNHFWNYQLYIIFFPKLIAGPIVRYHDIADQITDRSKNDTIDNRLTGFFRFVIGLSKKLLIANTLGREVDIIFAMDPTSISTGMAWVGIVAYSFQIYFDFSGYSDMALGIAKMVGFKLPENFNNPYVSQSITEFWRRWHISLGSWMRNYLYIPLGGNKVKTNARLYFNLCFVFVASGLWHGAAWTFVVWGAYHGLFLVLDRLFLLRFFKKIGKFPSIFITFFLAMIGWVFFRSDTLTYAFDYIGRLFAFDGVEFTLYLDNKFWFYIVMGFLFSFITMFGFGKKIESFFYERNYYKADIIPALAVCLMLLFLSVGTIAIGGFNPFIYFRF
ncbi:MAG TPA: MBOAT family O-acyltransferase [Bacteroidales bacterium]|nr:MBOAT family O-acyltransferase [Bacteroidales bacterium]